MNACLFDSSQRSSAGFFLVPAAAALLTGAAASTPPPGAPRLHMKVDAARKRKGEGEGGGGWIRGALSWARSPGICGRSDLEALLGSNEPQDWVRISERLLGPPPATFVFAPKHKAQVSLPSQYQPPAPGPIPAPSGVAT